MNVVVEFLIFSPGVIITLGIAYFLVKRASSKSLDRDTLATIEDLRRRTLILEGRLNDIQDILITVDEKLKRREDA